jgi:hypothetical protein
VTKRLRFTTFLALPVALALQACGGNQMSPATPSQSLTSMALAPQTAPTAPAQCAGQTSTSLFAAAPNETFSNKPPRALCVPEFEGWGGTIKYPTVTASMSGTATSSTTNYTGQLPKLTVGDAKPMFYFQMTTSGPATFGPKVRGGGGLTSKALVPGKTYYVRGQAAFAGPFIELIPFAPCQEKATPGPHGGVLSHIGDMFANQVFDRGNGTITILIYRRGKGVTQPC